MIDLRESSAASPNPQAIIESAFMNDQPNTPAPQQTPAGIVEHWCQHEGCAKWGSFGFATGRAEPRWYCGEHRSSGEMA